MEHIKQLKVGDLLKRVDSLVEINDTISLSNPQNRESDGENGKFKALVYCSNELVGVFIIVMNDIFRHAVQDIPLRFTKYFITIVNKTCSSKEIMKEVNEKFVHELVAQLLNRLLIENLDKIGNNGEGGLILKNLNASMLRMLENCNHTYIFGILFKLLKNSKNGD